MKPDFFVARATSKTFKIIWFIHNYLSPEGHLTFMDNPIIRIAAKFQYKLPLLRTLAVMDTISWSRGRPHRKGYRCTSLQRSWSPKAAVDVTTLNSSAPTWETGVKNSSVERYYYYYYYYYCCCFCFLSIMIIIIGFTFPPSIHFKLTKCNKCYYIVRKVLQSATGTQSVTIITKCDRKDPR